MARSKFHIDEDAVLDQKAPIGSSEPEEEKLEKVNKKIADSTYKNKKVGRPKTKTEPTKNINIAVPVSVLEQIEFALPKYQGNLTKYVNTVIENDLKTNMKEYKKIYNILNN